MILAHLKLTLQAITKNFFLTLFLMVLFPVVLLHMMSYFNADMYEQPAEDLNIPVRIVDEDQTAASDLIRQTLASQQLHGMIEFSDEPDFTVTIPEGYTRALEANEPVEIAVAGIVDASSRRGELLRSIIDSVSTRQQSLLRLESAMQSDALTPDDANRLRADIRKAQDPVVETRGYEPAVRITARENFSLQYLQLIFIMFLTSYATSLKQQNETTDLAMRMNSVPVHPLMLQVSEMFSAAFQVFLYSITYILINRIFGWGFTGNLAAYVLALLFASFFVAAVSMAFAAIVPPKFAPVLGSVVMMIIMFFGGMVGSPLMFRGTPFESLAALDIGRILVGPFRDVNLGVFSAHSLLLFAVGTAVGIVVTALADRVKKGVLS